jgi:hypothetical protein
MNGKQCKKCGMKWSDAKRQNKRWLKSPWWKKANATPLGDP